MRGRREGGGVLMEEYGRGGKGGGVVVKESRDHVIRNLFHYKIKIIIFRNVYLKSWH